MGHLRNHVYVPSICPSLTPPPMLFFILLLPYVDLTSSAERVVCPLLLPGPILVTQPLPDCPSPVPSLMLHHLHVYFHICKLIDCLPNLVILLDLDSFFFIFIITIIIIIIISSSCSPHSSGLWPLLLPPTNHLHLLPPLAWQCCSLKPSQTLGAPATALPSLHKNSPALTTSSS